MPRLHDTPTIALAMSSELLAAGGTAEDRLLARVLGEAGLPAEAVSWSGDEDWSRFAGVLVRSCWDYHLSPDAFRDWLERLETLDVRVWNPVPLLRWNVDKRYLLDLEGRGVKIVPTLVRDAVGGHDLGELSRRLGAPELVVKPVIGATAHGCRRVRTGESAAGGITTESPGEIAGEPGGPWLVQPFVDAVETEGEWSLMLFAGELCHAVLKRPAPGEYRVQKQWGGSARRERPGPALVDLATAVVAAIEPAPLYARVDLVRLGGRPCLMELELIEPELFLREGDRALDLLVDGLRG
jgi:glutathione synthase/RimK-type ligase-like ATP-grasp enzyme